MSRVMSKAGTTKLEARAFMERWKTVNAMEKQALRITSADEKLNQLAELMTLAAEFGWKRKFKREERKVRDRWNRLRKVCSV